MTHITVMMIWMVVWHIVDVQWSNKNAGFWWSSDRCRPGFSVMRSPGHQSLDCLGTWTNLHTDSAVKQHQLLEYASIIYYNDLIMISLINTVSAVSAVSVPREMKKQNAAEPHAGHARSRVLDPMHPRWCGACLMIGPGGFFPRYHWYSWSKSQ